MRFVLEMPMEEPWQMPVQVLRRQAQPRPVRFVEARQAMPAR